MSSQDTKYDVQGIQDRLDVDTGVAQGKLVALRRIIVELTHAIVIAERHPSLAETRRIIERALDQAKRDHAALLALHPDDAATAAEPKQTP